MEAPKKGKNPRKNYFGEGGQRMWWKECCFIAKIIGEEYNFFSHLVLLQCQMWKLKYKDSNNLPQTLCTCCFQTSTWRRLKKGLSNTANMIKKISIFSIPEDPKNPYYILPCKPISWKEIKNH
jgi:hypothetical protein